MITYTALRHLIFHIAVVESLSYILIHILSYIPFRYISDRTLIVTVI